MYLVTAKEMQEMDARTIDPFGIPGRVLMEIAGRGATDHFLSVMPPAPGQRVGVLAGPGNNGGDGHVMARLLHDGGIDVTVYLAAPMEKVKGDALENLLLLEKMGIPVREIPGKDAFTRTREEMAGCDLWIDALLGTGLSSDVREYYASLMEFINEQGKPVFAVDIPSGTDSDTGQVRGACIEALATATFGFAKIGHYTHPGRALRGKLKVVDIGIPGIVAKGIAPLQHLLTKDAAARLVEKRAADAHKGDTGHLLALCGSPGKTGAAALCAMAAMRAGAGLVTLGVPSSVAPVLEPMVIEPMTVSLPCRGDGTLGESAWDKVTELIEGRNCLALGPGLGWTPSTAALVHRIVGECPLPLVLDADGLNCIAENPERLKSAKAPVVLTPHPKEMSRLTGLSTAEVQADRVGCARAFATEYGVHLVLKGAGTLIAHPDGNVTVNTSGNAGMASGGMGDLLTGIIAGLVVQGYEPGRAAELGVFLHGRAADSVLEKTGGTGYLATDVLAELPAAAARLP